MMSQAINIAVDNALRPWQEKCADLEQKLAEMTAMHATSEAAKIELTELLTETRHVGENYPKESSGARRELRHTKRYITKLEELVRQTGQGDLLDQLGFDRSSVLSESHANT